MCARDNDAAAGGWQQLPADERVDEVVEGLRMLADPTRLRLLWLLCGEELDVSSLAERLGVARPAVSQHLAKLRLVGLITQRRDGRRVLSRARDHHVGELLADLVHDAGHRLAAR
ncbi:ArsR/SmtB family transcription factor [Actinomycetospora termitidis]|uniref:Metalloregulator ArsR/SmtB family transcription factor n=1 Tax=Actinomycetospora termitidis TaxID=3053470 RepID=A0ABT7MCM1_9PSEU|nr:metalloregulator ArsR/SmtB family transcription factor [Actinomycetospora sp. Odt1-22]MDL5158421.1 metalloregulator ArsR/SmtB family transcription factor [Actinomycetospora sp. Odt1-22]